MKFPIAILLAVLVLQFSSTNGYNILAVFPHNGASHFMVFRPLMERLAELGHNVTVLSHFPKTNNLATYHAVSLKESNSNSAQPEGVIDSKWLKTQPSLRAGFQSLADLGIEDCNLIANPNVQNLIKSKPKFDVIIHEFFNNDCFLILNYLLQVPIIGIHSCKQIDWHLDRSGISLMPAYESGTIMGFTEKMTFYERVWNTMGWALFKYIFPNLYLNKETNTIVRKHFGDHVPDLEDIAKNYTAIQLLSQPPILFGAKSLPPNVIEVSGLHIPQKVKKLPQDIEKFINESKHGVIYFSLGSLVRGSSFPEEDRRKFIEVFNQIPQRVLWKYENESLPERADSVMVKKWMPQYDILSHPNVKVFISHSGLLGVLESLQTGTPMINLPLMADQFGNAKAASKIGLGTLLNFNDLKVEDIRKAVKFALDQKTQAQAKKLARLYEDQPQSRMDRAVWWVEYVARNGGADNLRSISINMPLYQTLLLDVFAFFVGVVALVIFVVYKLGKVLLNLAKGNKIKKD